jgi:hypothetical protein
MKTASTATPATRAKEEELKGRVDLLAVAVKAASPRLWSSAGGYDFRKANVAAHELADVATAGVGKYV